METEKTDRKPGELTLVAIDSVGLNQVSWMVCIIPHEKEMILTLRHKKQTHRIVKSFSGCPNWHVALLLLCLHQHCAISELNSIPSGFFQDAHLLWKPYLFCSTPLDCIVLTEYKCVYVSTSLYDDSFLNTLYCKCFSFKAAQKFSLIISQPLSCFLLLLPFHWDFPPLVCPSYVKLCFVTSLLVQTLTWV